MGFQLDTVSAHIISLCDRSLPEKTFIHLKNVNIKLNVNLVRTRL